MSLAQTAIHRIKGLFDNEEPAICVNAMWRTSSTFIWSKFRNLGSYCCFLEPLHEDLSTLTGEIQAADPSNLTRAHRHPALRHQYFYEYPVLASGGVPRFLKRFSFENYHLEPGQEDTALRAYFSNLIAHARNQGLSPMFQPNRMLFRGRWFKAQFPCVHIFLLRNPWDIWASMTSFPNYYFPCSILRIFALNEADPLFGNVARALELPRFSPHDRVTDDMLRPFALEHAAEMATVFYYLYLTSTMYNLSFSDLVLDIDAIAECPQVRAEVERRLARLGGPPDLSGCALPPHTPVTEFHARAEERALPWSCAALDALGCRTADPERHLRFLWPRTRGRLAALR